MRSSSRDLQGFAVLILALIGAGFLLLRNVQSQRGSTSYGISGPTATVTKEDVAWQDVIQNQLVNGASPVPTRQLQLATYIPPTLPPVEGTPILLQPSQIFQEAAAQPTRHSPSQPVLAAPTAGPSPTAQVVVSSKNNVNEGQFAPPPEQVPLSADPRDHFWFGRPVDTSANSNSLQYYTYGSDGPQNAWRIHHGLDMPNPVGKEVHAAADGKVVWAADHYQWIENGRVTDAAYTYGNVVIIEHDFGYQGQHLYTLYAHLSVILAQQNQRVKKGDVIGLSGQSGVVSGPHVHFEVRVGENNYFFTRNPILWMAPYLNHGVIAGIINYRDGTPVYDATVSLFQGGKIVDTTTTYINVHRPGMRTWNVNSDDVWGENFVFGDVPVGDYQVAVNINGIQLKRDITVRPVTTTFIDLGQAPSGPGDNAGNTVSPTLAP